jgi:hypothetical protein
MSESHAIASPVPVIYRKLSYCDNPNHMSEACRGWHNSITISLSLSLLYKAQQSTPIPLDIGLADPIEA